MLCHQVFAFPSNIYDKGPSPLECNVLSSLLALGFHPDRSNLYEVQNVSVSSSTISFDDNCAGAGGGVGNGFDGMPL